MENALSDFTLYPLFYQRRRQNVGVFMDSLDETEFSSSLPAPKQPRKKSSGTRGDVDL